MLETLGITSHSIPAVRAMRRTVRKTWASEKLVLLQTSWCVLSFGYFGSNNRLDFPLWSIGSSEANLLHISN